MWQQRQQQQQREEEDSTSPANSSFQRAWCEVQRYLLGVDWLDNTFSSSAECEEQEQRRDYGYLLGFLRKYPALAGEKFGGYSGCSIPFQFMEREKKKKAFPLAYLLAAHAPLQVIQEVYKMYPRAISERQGEQQGLPLHIACSHGVSFETIQFLVEENGDAVREYDRNSNLPLHLIAKARRARQPTTDDNDEEAELLLQILELLISKYPTSLIKENALGISPLVYAIKNDTTTSESTMNFLVQSLPDTTFSGEIQFNGVVVGDPFARNLNKLIPKLQFLTLKGCQITDPGLIPTILINSNNLSLSLVNCKMKDEPLPPARPLAPSEEEEGLFHDNNDFLQPPPLPPPEEADLLSPLGGIQQLTINNCSMKDSTFQWLLNQIILIRMDQLKELTLTNPSKNLRAVNITDFIVSILRRTTRPLTTLTIDGHALALQTLIDVLANENRITYVDYKNNVHNPLVKYYSTMNQFGRAACTQDPNTTSRETIVEHLSNLHSCPSLYGSYKTIVTYGLLRESVPLWSCINHENDTSA